MTTTLSMPSFLESWLGEEAEDLLTHKAKVSKDLLHLPSPDSVDRIFAVSDRSPQVLRSLQQLYSTGRLANTGYLSILPVDQGIEHSAGASFAPNPIYFDPENIIKLALEAGCNAVATTLGVLGIVSRKYAHKIPFIVKLNHNELLTFPNQFFGATCVATLLNKTRTITWQLTSQGRRIIWASRLKPTSLNRSCPNITTAIQLLPKQPARAMGKPMIGSTPI